MSDAQPDSEGEVSNQALTGLWLAKEATREPSPLHMQIHKMQMHLCSSHTKTIAYYLSTMVIYMRSICLHRTPILHQKHMCSL